VVHACLSPNGHRLIPLWHRWGPLLRNASETKADRAVVELPGVRLTRFASPSFPSTESTASRVRSSEWGPETAVGVECLDYAHVAEPSLNGLHGLPVPDQLRGDIVPQRVEPGPGGQAGRLHHRPPEVTEHLPGDGLALDGEHQPVAGSSEVAEMARERVDDDLRQRDRADAAAVLGGARYGARPARVTSCRSTSPVRRRKSIRSTVRPRHSPCRMPIPAAKVMSAASSRGIPSRTVCT
jgi:hypothetical protein